MATSERRIRVAVIFGGRSTEHAISCVSAGSMLSALDRDTYQVLPVGITPDGGWVLAPDDPKALAISGRELPQVVKGSAVVLPADPTAGGLVVAEPGDAVRALGEVDVVFPLLHGAYGEDGTVQGLLEMAGIPYVGAGVLASAVCMDKEYTKKLLRVADLPVGDYAVLRPGEDESALSAADRDRLGLPVFVKPARAGSSIGISRVTSWDDLAPALAMARQVDPKVLVEAAVSGHEIECGVLEGEDGGPPQASVLAEIRLAGGTDWYDFEAKYLDEACEFDVPARLPVDVTERVQTMACRAFTALDCAGLARVDFFVADDGSVVVNEVNTMPGFTLISMFPRMWAASGLDYPALLDRLVRTALRRGIGLR
ncbi:MAG TPA: D-alanine--D-alanine ligase family protein [Mycobacteriales bacterium]|nr:D-alanine--D-alanine ligase family protein [Mycobacteriales bacterium]